MLSLPNDGRYPALELAPQQRRQKTLEALTAQVVALARSNPVLMIFEDVHWVDPTSLEVAGRAWTGSRTLAFANHHVPTGVRAAVDRTASRHSPDTQPARGA